MSPKYDAKRGTTPRQKIFKRILFATTTVLIVGLIWIGWPIYGFLSNQYETARLPWGWTDLPVEAPIGTSQVKPAFVEAGEKATRSLKIRRAKIGAPSLSAAISINGELVWANAVGWENVAKTKAASHETIYRIGSTSKAVMATGLARLIAEGTMDLNAPISTYSKDLPNPKWNAFTPRQLISHTAGLTAYEENNDWIGFYHSLALRYHFADPKASLSVFDGADLLYEAGTQFHYSGFDNVLLSAVMQDAAKKPFNVLMSSRVFAPNNLTALQPAHDVPRKAVSYQAKGSKVKPWRSVDLSQKLAAGGYASTPSDLAILGAAWLDGDFIPADIREVFWTPLPISNEQDYALGFRRKSWPIDGVGEVEHLNHGGVSKGAQCWLMIIPKHNMTLAISTNRRTDNFSDFASAAFDLLEIFIPASKDTAQNAAGR